MHSAKNRVERPSRISRRFDSHDYADWEESDEDAGPPPVRHSRPTADAPASQSGIWRKLRGAIGQLTTTVAKNRATRDRFRRLMAELRAEKMHSSAIEDWVLHPAYLRLIGMGADAVPLVIAELQRRPGPWFTALYAITEAEPVPPEDEGNMQKMTEAWVRWASQNSYR